MGRDSGTGPKAPKGQNVNFNISSNKQTGSKVSKPAPHANKGMMKPSKLPKFGGK